MNRRRFLAACSAGLAGLAGCGADTDETGATGDVRGEVRVGRGLSEAAAVSGLLVVASHGRRRGYGAVTVL